MDEPPQLQQDLGYFEQLWINGFNGQKAHFVDDSNVMYTCDSTVKIVNVKTKQIRTYQPFDASENVTLKLLTANASHKKFAFSDSQIPPSVYVKDLENFIHIAKLSDDAQLEYLHIEFSNGDVMFTLSGVPDLKLTVWNWKSGEKVVEMNLRQSELPLYACFSPTNWRHISVAYKHEIELWKIEQCDAEYKTSKSKFSLPYSINQEISENDNRIDFNGNLQERVPYPNSIIAGVGEDLEDSLDDLLDKTEKQSFRCLCWGTNDDLFIATDSNHMYKYSLGDKSLQFVFASEDQASSAEEADTSKKIKFEDGKEEDVSAAPSRQASYSIDRMLIHRHGVLLSGSDGIVRILDNDSVRVLYDMQSSFISNLSANSDYSTLAITTDRGVYVTSIASESLRQQHEILIANESANQLRLVVDYSYGPTVGIENIHPLNDFFLVLKKNGALQTWGITHTNILHTTHLGTECSVLATHPYMPLACVGTQSGHLIFIDCSDYKVSLRVIDKYRLHQKAVRKLKFNTSGTLLFSVGEDNKIYTIDSRLTDKTQNVIMKQEQKLINAAQPAKSDLTGFNRIGFYVLGFTEFDGELVSFDTVDMFNETTKGISTRVGVSLYDAAAAETIRKNDFSANGDNASPVNAEYNVNLLLNKNNDDVGHKVSTKLLCFEISFELFEDKSRLYVNAHKYDFRDEVINKLLIHSHYLFTEFAFLSRSYVVAFVNRNVCKFGIPDVDLTKKVTKIPHLEFSEVFGVHEIPYGSLIRSLNSQFIITAGYDSTVAVRSVKDSKLFTEMKGHHFELGGYHLVALTNDSSFLVSVGRDMSVMAVKWNCDLPEIQKASIEGEYDASQLKKLPSNSLMNSKGNQPDLTWLELREIDYYKVEDEQFVPVKSEIMKGLGDIKVRLQDLMKVNNTREDIAKLEEHEFYLDLEELEKLHKDADLKILTIRETKDLENTANLYLREIIKKECWDKMRVKGRGVEAFGGSLFVENYPLKDRSKAELKVLERMQMIRRIELAEEKSRKEILSDLIKKDQTHTLIEKEDDELKDGENSASNSNMSQNQSQGLTPYALKGSIGSMFDGESPYFYNQFEMYSCEQKWMQVLLIQDAIYKIKENFNKEFEQVMQRKQQEMAKIKEKNQRIKQIYIDLDEERPLKEPDLSEVENPELLFEVKDEEIKVEKYLTPEQRKQLEDQLAEEMRRRELEKLDNWRERGLMEMMGGVLQIRREDELKKDIPVPAFVKEKPQEEWSQDEIKQFQVYEQKVKELNEEREKLRKQLNAEVNKLQEQIQECYQNFDNILLQLHYRKIRTQQAVYQEELKISRLLNSLIIHTELDRRENQINRKLETLKESKKELTQEIARIKKSIEAYKEEYEILGHEDKAQDKAFQREFSDVPVALREPLFKLFKRRIKTRFQIMKTNMNPQNIYIQELGTDNPCVDRPSTAQQIQVQDIENERALADMDNIANAPIGVDQNVWERFVNYRRAKIEVENTLKYKSLTLTEMNAYMAKRQEENEQKQREIDEYIRNLQLIQELKIRFDHNLQVQLIVKQGQVETDPGPNVHNFESCLLINRSVVDALNKVIQAHGKQKISIMVECKDFKKGIRQLEWDQRHKGMQIEDLIQKQRDITYLKLTREVQEYLSSADYDAKKQKEISVLEQTLVFQQEQYKKKYGEQNVKVHKVKNESTKIANSNYKFDDKLAEENVVLNEKKHIDQDIFGKNVERAREERFKQITQRRRFVDLAKAQAQEVAFLRSEVERLRMKTFPALVQIEF